jgi:hypothetical protein
MARTGIKKTKLRSDMLRVGSMIDVQVNDFAGTVPLYGFD